MLKYIVAIFAINSIGCDRPDCQGKYYFTYENAGEVGTKVIARAENNWFRWAGKPVVSFEPVANKTSDVCFVDFTEKPLGKDNIVWLGYTSSDNNYIEIHLSSQSNFEGLVATLSHELGHSLGLDHVADENSVMSEFGNPSKPSNWSKFDQTECQNAGVCEK